MNAPEQWRDYFLPRLIMELDKALQTPNLERAPVAQSFGSLVPDRLALAEDEQEQVMDMLAERIQTLGGVETARNQLERLVEAHEFILVEARPLARDAESSGDAGTHDIIVGQVVRGNELQSWYVTRTLSGLNGSV